MSKRLLVVDGERGRRRALSQQLSDHLYSGVAVSPERLMERPPEPMPEAVIVTDADPSLPRVLRKKIGNAPLLFLDPEGGDERRLAALRAGARDSLPSGVAAPLLFARLRGLLREADTAREFERRRIAATSFGFAESADAFGRARVVFYVGGESGSQLLQPCLSHKVTQVAANGALEPSGRVRPDAIVIEDAVLAAALLPELRGRAHSRHAPVLALYDPGEIATAVQILDLGAADVVPKSAAPEELALRLNAMLARGTAEETLRSASEKSYHFAQTDPLTGLYNRRYAETYLKTTLLAEPGREFTLMLGDIDHFKAINDTYGHPAGDDVLAGVADRLKENLRAVDLIARFGGEEFLIVLPGTSADEAEAAADRVREIVASKGFPARGADAPLAVTMSIGVSVEPKDAAGDVSARLERRLAAADRGLYAAKGAGRNRVSLC